MKLNSILSEAMLFKDFHEIKVDPDRDDSHDIKDKLLPVIVKMAYTNLYHDRTKHEGKYGAASDDEDAYNFDFTEDALSDMTEELLDDLAEKLKNISSSDIKSTIMASIKDFPAPLDKKKQK